MSLAVSSNLRRQQHQQHYSCSDDELSCKICLAVYSQRSVGQRPRTLQCHHTFCESCLQQLATDRRRPRKVQAEGSAATVKCPLCKYRTCLGPTAVQGLPVNSTAIQHCGQMSGVRSRYGRQLQDLQPRCAVREVRGKGNSKIHFMSCGTSGNRVMVQRFENFHPPPKDGDDDIWARALSHRRILRFADDDPSSRDVDTSSPDVEHAYRSSFSPTHDLEDSVDQNDGVFEDLTPVAVHVGQFGHYDEAPDGRPATLRSPWSIDCACDGRLLIVDADSGSVQIFARNGDCLSGFRLVGARAACFIRDVARGELQAVVTSSGVSICDQTGCVDKHLPVGTDVVGVAPLRHGGGIFAAAHRNRITICDSYKPTAVLRSISCVRPMNTPLGHSGIQFSDIVALATTATPRLYVVDAATVQAVDTRTGTLLQTIAASLCQPTAVAVDLVTGSVFVCDSRTGRVMQFDADGGRRRCLVELANDVGRCVALAAGPRTPDGHQLIYVVCRGPASAEVRMYQI